MVPVCLIPKDVPEDVARNGWIFSPSGSTVIRMRRDEFKKKASGQIVYVYQPGAPAENTKKLPIAYHQLPCTPDPSPPPPPVPPVPPPAPTAGPPPPPAGGSSGGAPKAAAKKAAKPEEGEVPADLPPPIVYPKKDPEPKPRPPRHGVTTHWPATVLPIKRARVDTQTKVLPTAHVLPVTQPKVDTHTKVLPTAHVLPFKHEVKKPGQGGEGGGGSSTGKAPNKVAKKTMFEKIAEQTAIAGAVANLKMNEDLNRPDGKRFGIVGGTNADGPNHPAVQAGVGAVLVAAAVLSAGASKLVKKLEAGLANKTPLLYKEMKDVSEDVAEELVTKLGPKLGAADVRAGLADALSQNGAVGPYSVMKQFTDKLGGKWQAHHILEVQFAKRFKLGNPDKVPSVILTDAQHKEVTAALAEETVKVRNSQELWQAYQKVYKKYPSHWLESIKPYFVKGK